MEFSQFVETKLTQYAARVVDDGALHDSTGTVSGGQGAPSERLSVFLPLVHR